MSAHSRPAQSRASKTAQRSAGTAAQRSASTAAQRSASTAEAERLTALLEPTASAMGIDLEGIKITAAGRRRLLRITVDADGGVSLDDVQKVSRQLSAVLDETAGMGEAPYTLEVSSPGVDRPLTEPRHWRRAAGRLVTVTVLAPADAAAQQAGAQQAGAQQDEAGQDGPAAAGSPVAVQGRILRAGDLGVTLDIDGSVRRFRYGELGPGRIQIEFGHPDDGPADGADEGTDEEEPDGY